MTEARDNMAVEQPLQFSRHSADATGTAPLSSVDAQSAAVSSTAHNTDVPAAALCGIFTPGQQQTALLIVVGGPQYRVGSHRQFVKLCRAAARAQFASLRFDVSGMGDSSGPAITFYQQQADIQAAIDALFCRQPTLKSVVLWGLCDGASAILLHELQQADPRVKAMVLLNPWVRQQHSYAQTMVKHYYWQRLTQKTFWQKLFSGQLQLLHSARALWQNLQQSRQRQQSSHTIEQSNEHNYVSHMLKGWQQFMARGGQVTLITSGNDLTAKEFLDLAASTPAWQTLLQQAEHHHLAAANHTFSSAQWRAEVEQYTINCLQQCETTSKGQH